MAITRLDGGSDENDVLGGHVVRLRVMGKELVKAHRNGLFQNVVVRDEHGSGYIAAYLPGDWNLFKFAGQIG